MLYKKVTWWDGSWHRRYFLQKVNKHTVWVLDDKGKRSIVPRSEVCYGWVDNYEELPHHFENNKI